MGKELKDTPEPPTHISREGLSFEELVAANQLKVRRYIASLGADHCAVDDIAQEAFIVAYKRFDSFQQTSTFSTWVNSIARNLLWNERRKTQRRHKIINEKMTDILIEQNLSEDVVEHDDDEARRSALRLCMGLLPDAYRTLVELRYRRDLEPTRIAEELGEKPVTIRQRLLRVRKALRDCMSKQNGVPAE